jgi:hypothetical protein
MPLVPKCEGAGALGLLCLLVEELEGFGDLGGQLGG